MKMKRQLSMMLALIIASTGLVRAAVIEKPVVLKDAMVTLTISDLHGFIDGVGGVAAQVSPMTSGLMIKNMAGMQLGDPGLTGIAPGKGLAIVMLDQTNLFAVVEVNEAQSAAYSAALSQKGLQSKYADGVLVVGASADQVAKGAAQVAAIKETLLAKRNPSLNISAQPAALIEQNSAQIDSMLMMMPMMVGMGMAQSPGMDPAAMEPTVRILEGELRVVLSLAKQCDIAELVLMPKDGSLQINETFVPRSGTRLATLLNAPKTTKANSKVQAALLGEGAIALDCTLANPEALTTFISEELDLVLKDMGIESEPIAKMNESMKKWIGLYNGSFSENIGFGGESFMNVAYVLDIKDEAETLAMFKTMEQDLAAFLDLYKSLGMPMTVQFKENAREYNGVKIHQFKVSLSLPEEDMAAVGAMNMNLSNMVYDVAICDGLLLYAMGDTKVETLIDRVKDTEFKAEPLKARSIYPADGIFYCDVDVGSYMAGISSIMPADPDNPLPQIAAMLKGADPVTAAGFREGGMVLWSVNIPASLMTKIGQAVMAVQMQQMQQMQTMQQTPQQPPQVTPGSTPGGMPAGLEATPLP